MDSVMGLGELNYYKRSLIIRTKIGEILLFNTVFSKKQGGMARVGNWVDYFRDPLDKHIDLENMWEICSPHVFTVY
jgi:hypothetical protein